MQTRYVQARGGARPAAELLPDATRRALLGAIPAAAIAAFVIAPAPGPLVTALDAESSDEQFQAWEREWSRYEALLTVKGAWPEERQHEFDDRLDEQSLIQRLILETPSTTLTSARTKARLLLHYARQNFEPDGAALAMQHILRAVENVL